MSGVQIPTVHGYLNNRQVNYRTVPIADTLKYAIQMVVRYLNTCLVFETFQQPKGVEKAFGVFCIGGFAGEGKTGVYM